MIHKLNNHVRARADSLIDFAFAALHHTHEPPHTQVSAHFGAPSDRTDAELREDSNDHKVPILWGNKRQMGLEKAKSKKKAYLNSLISSCSMPRLATPPSCKHHQARHSFTAGPAPCSRM